MTADPTQDRAATPFERLLRGEITPEHYVSILRKQAKARMRQLRRQKWGSW